MKKSVTTIVPVYNTIFTLPECMESFLGQTAHENLKLELILVDDASKDGSSILCQNYANAHPDTIRAILLPENHGPGYARNVGISEAKGDYITFLDADDVIADTMIERLYEKIEAENADVVDCGFYQQSNDTAALLTPDDLTGKMTPEKQSALIVSGGYVYTKMFRRSFLAENNITFRKEYVMEDTDFLVEVFAKANGVSNVKEILYIYRDQPASTSKVADTQKFYHSATTAMEAIFEKTHSLSNYKDIQAAVEYMITMLYSYIVSTSVKEYRNIGNRDEILASLTRLAKMKKTYVRGDYENPYVQTMISKEDIELMKENDSSPEKLLDSIR